MSYEDLVLAYKKKKSELFGLIDLAKSCGGEFLGPPVELILSREFKPRTKVTVIIETFLDGEVKSFEMGVL